MTPLDQSISSVISMSYSAIEIIISFILIAIPLALWQYAKNHCWFGHSYRMKEATNNNGIWTVERECERCHQKLTEITDTKHFRIGRT